MLRLSRSISSSIPRWARFQSTNAAAAKSEAAEEAEIVVGRCLQPAQQHPRTHDIPVANIHFRSHSPRLLELFTHFASHAASSLGIPTSKTIFLPTQRRLWTVIRSPFVYKKSQENFERKVHKRAIKAWDADPEVVEQWVKYLRVNMLGGVAMKVTRWEHLPLGVGQSRLRDVELMVKPSVEEQIRNLGEEILKEELPPTQSKPTSPSTS
ncbi:hypothetical protein NP233_g26 [Leucocoprinus birnbaumii]|uniref:Small ribosomal subunit protein uS10m n=1 Tax=Leucocoprinus birnbaumii TaxID=56174 RepID=A0AAD5W321_9AGAR|nr:hypothetical protein NP233_g26 [Leucocoprinus birnbaumii]